MEAWKEICRGWVERYLPHEAAFFDVTWDAIQEIGIDKLPIGGSDEAISELGALGAQEGQQLYEVGFIALVSFVAGKFANTGLDRTTKNLRDTLEEGGASLGVPEFIRDHCRKQLGFFARVLKVVDWEEDEPTDLQTEARFIVEECKAGKRREARRLRLTEEQIEGEIEPKKDEFTLYVDEREDWLCAGEIGTYKMQDRHRFFLGLILLSMRKKEPLEYRDVVEVAWNERDEKMLKDKGDVSGRVRRLRAELNALIKKFIGCDLQKFMHPLKNEMYSMGNNSSYCWIRAGSGVSILLRY